MIKDGIALVTVGALLIAISTSATLACDRPVELDNAQINHHIALLKSDQANEVEQIDGIETLMCAARNSVRALAAKTALASPNDAIRASMLLEVMMQKQGIIIDLIAEDSLSNESIDYVKKHVGISVKFLFHNKKDTCIGIYRTSSCNDYFVDITGLNVEFHLKGDAIGNFYLDNSGMLKGYYKPSEIQEKIPATVRLL